MEKLAVNRPLSTRRLSLPRSRHHGRVNSKELDEGSC